MCEGFTFGDRQVGRILPRTLLRGRPFGGYVESLRKPVKQHICCFYWLTRGGEAAVGERAGGGVLVHKECPRGRGSILSTRTFYGTCFYTNLVSSKGAVANRTSALRALVLQNLLRTISEF